MPFFLVSYTLLGHRFEVAILRPDFLDHLEYLADVGAVDVTSVYFR